jgi:hypothetical protein
MLKKWHVIVLLLTVTGLKARAQQLDSIYFNLYTDSLKKGTYNYINVEGKYKDGRYQPLGDKELKFTASRGVFHGNSLYVDSSITDDKIRIKVSVIGNPRLTREIDIYIKRPISVRGCFKSPRMGSSGHVHTSAPASAHLTMWRGLRIEAASISVL